MTWMLIAFLCVAALLLVFSLVKKLVKLAFTVVLLIVLGGAIWYFWQQDPEMPEPVREVMEKAGEVAQESAEVAIDKAGEIVQEGAEVALEKGREALESGVDSAIGESAKDGSSDDTSPAGNEVDEQ